MLWKRLLLVLPFSIVEWSGNYMRRTIGAIFVIGLVGVIMAFCARLAREEVIDARHAPRIKRAVLKKRAETEPRLEIEFVARPSRSVLLTLRGRRFLFRDDGKGGDVAPHDGLFTTIVDDALFKDVV